MPYGRLLTDHRAGPSLSLDIKLLMYDYYNMKVYLVRHGQTDWNLKGLRQGQHDIPLNDSGREQARIIQDKLSDIDFDICFASPLKRAAETAEIICNKKCKIVFDDRLKERGFGKTEGMPNDSFDMKDDWHFGAVFEDKDYETIEQLFERAQSFLADLKKVKAKNVLIVSHGSFAKALHYSIVGYDKNTNFLGWFLLNCEYDSYDLL